MKGKMMKTKLKMTVLAASLMATCIPAAALDTRVNLLDFRDHVAAAGTEQEDWQPAFQKAVAKAYATSRILYIPAGTYPIRKTVDLNGPKTQLYLINSLTVTGDGRSVTTIIQKNPKENCISWTGKTYKDSATSGTLRDITLFGGKITLNLKWHNNFTLESCYIANASQAGIYSEGWSNRFLNMIIRHCPNNGFEGRAHFNDITIRDGYFSRCGVGIMLSGGARGVRISGIGFEHCANAALMIYGSNAVSITGCYFEGNGMGASNVRRNWAFPSSIALDCNNDTVLIQGCIFRGCSQNAGHVKLGSNDNVEIRNNLFDIHFDEAAVELTDPSRAVMKHHSGRVRLKHNSLVWSSKKQQEKKGAPVEFYYQESRPGLLKSTLRHGCFFESHEGKTRISAPSKSAPVKNRKLEEIFH